MRSRWLLATSILISATFSAYAQGKPLLNPCGLLNAQEATALLGTPVTIEQRMNPNGLCLFDDSKGVPVFGIRGSIHGNKYDAYVEMRRVEGAMPSRSREEIHGLGDHAEILVTRQGAMILLIQKQAKLLTLSFLPGAGPDLATRKLFLEQFGRLAAARF